MFRPYFIKSKKHQLDFFEYFKKSIVKFKDASGKNRFDSPSPVEGWAGSFKKDLVIPANFECNHCVFQVLINVIPLKSTCI